MAAVPSYTPPLAEAVRLARRPMIAYGIFAATGILAIIVTGEYYAHGGKDVWQIPLFFLIGLLGVPVGQLLALTRPRVWIVGVPWILFIIIFIWIGVEVRWPEEFFIPVILFAFGFFSGFLSLQHRWQLFASFSPAVGWIGAVMIILNEEGRAGVWERSKVSAWTPVPLLLLAGFVVTFGIYLSQRHANHLELWQLLGGSPTRRLEHKADRGLALRRRNVGAMMAFAVVLFAFTAVIAPYLWRTGRGDHEGKDGAHGKDTDGEPLIDDDDAQRMRDKGKDIGDAIERFARDSAEASERLWPFLLAALLGRPLRRWLLLRHYRRPFWKKSPSDRIEGLWCYVREGMADAGLTPLATESLEEAVARVEAQKGPSPDLAAAAAIYGRARYGLGLGPGDVERAQGHAERAFTSLEGKLGVWQRLRRLYRKVG